MSKAVVPLPVIAVEDPVTRLGRPEAFGISQGGIVYSYQQIASQSALSSTGGLIGTVPQTINFVAPPPSPDIIVDRRVYLAITWIVYPSGSFVMGYPPFANQFDAPRAFPNMQAIQSVSAVINNNTITQQMDPIIALMSYNMSKELQDRDYSGAPSMLDQYPDYVTGGVNGQARNPLTDSSYNSVQIPRGGFPVVYANNVASDQTPGGSSPTYGPGGAQNAMYGSQYYPSATFTSIEPFFLTPFEQYGEGPGFFGVQTLNVSLQFTTNSLSRVWSHAVGPGSTAATWSALGSNGPVTVVASAAQLLFRYITPSPIKVMPSVMEYQYSALNIYLTQSAQNSGLSVPPLQAGPPVSSNSIQFNTIPDQIFIYLFRQQPTRDHTTSDTFGVIGQISINFMNQTGLLQSATQWDLYLMSKKNGYVGSFTEWGGSGDSRIGVAGYVGPKNSGSSIPLSGLRGSVLCIKPGLDLGLEPSIAPSMNGLYNFQITIQNWWNPCNGYTSATPAGGNTAFTLYVVTVTSGIVTIKDNGTVTQTGLLTRADVLRSQAAPALSAEEAIKNVGGTFFSNMLNPWRGRGARSLLGGGAALSGGTAAQAPSESQQQPVAPSAGSAPQQEYQYYIPRDKRKQMETPFEDPRDRALAPHLRGRGILSPERASPESIPMPEDDDMVYDTEDRYVREPRLRDSRTPSERYDAEMPDIPPERVSRRRNMSLDEDSELFDRTPGSHRAPMFR